MKPLKGNTRRGFLGNGAFFAALAPAGLLSGAAANPSSGEGAMLDVRRDFRAKGDGDADDTRALQNAIELGSSQHRPIILPPGTYKTTRPLVIPSNTMLIGSAPGLGFGCRIEPHACMALAIGGRTQSFHCSIENLMIWPRGAAPDCLIEIDNSYSITFRNVRIHNAQERLGSAAIKLLGAESAGGHGRCNGIIWDNLIVRNDAGQPNVAILAAAGCGSHRFMNPCLENYRTLIEWNGGQLDLFAPYTERAGRFGINCNVDADDPDAYLNTFGGVVTSAESGVACAIRANMGAFNSFGTVWGASASRAVHVYSIPATAPVFHGVTPNVSPNGRARFSGVDGWMNGVKFSGSPPR